MNAKAIVIGGLSVLGLIFMFRKPAQASQPDSKVFVLSEPSGYGYVSWPGSSAMAAHFEIRAENTNDVAVTRTLNLWRRTTVIGLPGNLGDAVVYDQNGLPVVKIVTLAPGETQRLVFDSGSYSIAYRQGNPCDLWVVDDKGTKSPVFTIPVVGGE